MIMMRPKSSQFREVAAWRRRKLFAAAAFVAAAAYALLVRLQLRDMNSLLGRVGASAAGRGTRGGTIDARFYERMDALFFDANASAARRACASLDSESNMLEHKERGSDQLFLDCMDALESAQEQVDQEACPEEPLLIHAYWATGPLPDVAELSMRSILHTQRPGCFRVLLWTSGEESQRTLSDQLSKYSRDLTVQRINSSDLISRMIANFPDIAGTISNASRVLESWGGDNGLAGLPIKLSDAVRFLVLAAYGGIYLDADNLVLRSLLPLVARDFAYRWSYSSVANTAVMGLRLRSPNTGAMLERVLGNASSPDDVIEWFRPWTFTGSLVHDSELNLDVEILPSAYFDGLWVLNDGYTTARNASEKRYAISEVREIFTRKLPEPIQTTDFFPGCFTYHWHNYWSQSIDNGTVAKIFLDYYDEKEGLNRLDP
jgi:hypothetical protein